MLIEFIYGPKNSTREHVSREVGAALIAGGFAVELEKPNPDAALELARKSHPPAGWSIVRGGQYGDKIFMRYDDGNGGRTLLEQVPPPRSLTA